MLCSVKMEPPTDLTLLLEREVHRAETRSLTCLRTGTQAQPTQLLY